MFPKALDNWARINAGNKRKWQKQVDMTETSGYDWDNTPDGLENTKPEVDFETGSEDGGCLTTAQRLRGFHLVGVGGNLPLKI